MKASVIIVNWNGAGMLRRNLPAALSQTFRDYEVIVVDNGSRDGSVELLRREFPAVRVVALADNRGFAGGNNAALPEARGEFIVTLNNDARPEPDWLKHLVEAAARRRAAGIVASKLVHDDGSIDSAGDLYGTTWLMSKIRPDGPARGDEREQEVFSACAGAALYRRSMLERIGFFDESFFLIYEDVDLSFRARLAGWKVLLAPRAVVHHEEGASLGRVPDVHAYHLYRNVDYVWIKNVPGRLLLKQGPAALLQRLLETWEAWRRLRGRFPIYLRAKRDVARALPRLLAERRLIQRSRRVSVDAIENAMTRVPTDRLSYWIDQVKRALRW